MSAAKIWNVEVYIGERDGHTYAEARLANGMHPDVFGTGKAKLHPAETDVPEIGDELAVARALADLSYQLLSLTAGDIETSIHEPVRLTR